MLKIAPGVRYFVSRQGYTAVNVELVCLGGAINKQGMTLPIAISDFVSKAPPPYPGDWCVRIGTPAATGAGSTGITSVGSEFRVQTMFVLPGYSIHRDYFIQSMYVADVLPPLVGTT